VDTLTRSSANSAIYTERYWGNALIRILLGHRGTLLRGALAAVLSFEDDLKVVGELARTDDVLPAAVRTRPDVVVLDLALPGTVPAADICAAVCQDLPDCAVLIVLDRRYGAALELVARFVPRVGVIATETSPRHFIEGVRQIARGEPVIDGELAVAALTATDNPLTDREREVLRIAVHGAPVKDIAAELFLSTGTVRNYLSRILAKTGARTRIEAIRIAQDAGWI